MRVTAITKYKHGDLFNLLTKLGWSQNELARRSGLTAERVGRIANLQYRPTAKQADAIQRAFAEVGEFFDVLECWPESFVGLQRGAKVTQTKDVDVETLLLAQEQMLLPQTSEMDVEELSVALEDAMSDLRPRDQQILKLRFSGKTLEETARAVGMTSRERVRQIEARALRKMRHPQRLKKLEEFLH